MKPQDEIARLMLDGDEDVRREAMRSLSEHAGSMEPSEVLRLLSLGMQDGSWRVRKSALDLLLEEHDAGDAIDLLIKLLTLDDNAGARNTAVEGLVRLGTKATKRLAGEFSTSNADVRKFIIDIAGEVGDPEANPMLIKALGDDDDNVRASAVEHLGTVREPAVVDALIGILSEGELWTAYPAAEALGKIGDQRAVPFLIKALEGGMLREPALRALGRLGDESVIEKIVPFVGDPSRAVQHMAIYALEELYHRGISEDAIATGLMNGLGKKAVPILIEQAASAREEIKASSILLLGLLKDERALTPLLELAQEDEFASDIRRALTFIGRQKPESLLHFANFENTLINRCISNVFSEVASPVFFDTLLKYLRSEDGHVRAFAAKGLGRIGNPEAVSILKNYLNDEFEDVQEAAVTALSAFKDFLDISELQENMKSKEADVRKNSVLLLGAIDSEEALSVACSALSDKSSLVRQAALKALSTKKSETALKHIEQALSDESPGIRATAGQVLGETKEDRFLGPLAALLGDEDDKVRASAAKALGTIGSQRAIEKLVEAMSDNSGFVVASAIEAIGKIGGDKAMSALIKALSHEEKEIQRAALHALSTYPGCEEIILPFLDDPDWATRTVAVQSLSQSKNEKVFREMQKALGREEDTVVRKVIMGALGDR